MKFTKMEGCGNDYVYVNGFDQKVPAPEKTAKIVSDRHFGIGADGLIIIQPSNRGNARMEMYNADGSRGDMCGNGIRCVAKYLYDRKIVTTETLDIDTDAGLKKIELTVEKGKAVAARVNMGAPFLDPKDIPVLGQKDPVVNVPLEINGKTHLITAVGMGNPHCVIYVDNVKNFPVNSVGQKIETHSLFPKKTNVEFVETVSQTEVKQRTWERGSGETLACGTGASAVCVAGVLTGQSSAKITNHLLGGDLILEWNGEGQPVFMTGPAVEVFSGDIAV